MLYVLGWLLLILLGAAAMAVGALTVALKHGAVTEEELVDLFS